MMRVLVVLVVFFVSSIDTGAVGECRSECVEQNKFRIVRVHLKDDNVMVGICRNTTLNDGNLASVIPMICDRNRGVWTFDESDEEGIAGFPVRCPPNYPVPAEQILTCPQSL